MGLDHGLHKKMYVKNWNYDGATKHKVELNGKEIEAVYIGQELTDWRKCNWFHGWFVDQCANGVDDCSDVRVAGHQLIELYDICKKVLKSFEGAPTKTVKVHTGWQTIDGKREDTFRDVDQFVSKYADDNLPCRQGFFFGGKNYDEWYIQSLHEFIKTIDDLKLECKHADLSDYEYTYWASW